MEKMLKRRNLKEAINVEQDLILKLSPVSEANVFAFMDTLHGGTYFNMGIYGTISPARAYKKTIKIYKVTNIYALVSGVSYENIGTTKEFRAETGKDAQKPWYEPIPGYEGKLAKGRNNPDQKYVLWDAKERTNTVVRFYLVDIATGGVQPVSRELLLNSDYLTQTEKNKLTPAKPTGYNLNTGELVTNETVWRTSKFEHIFWLKQGGNNAREYGQEFNEAFNIKEGFEDAGDNFFVDGNAHANRVDVDGILSGKVTLGTPRYDDIDRTDVIENLSDHLTEDASHGDEFIDGNADANDVNVDGILSGEVALGEASEKRRPRRRPVVKKVNTKKQITTDDFEDFFEAF